MIRFIHAGAAAVTVSLLLAGCSKSDDKSDAPVPHNVTLTDAQRQHIQIYTVQRSGFHRMVDTTGAVDFDNDQATSVIAPMSGPVTKLLVDVGDHVRKGQPLAMVESGDFAAATSAYAKALDTARTDRKVADADKDLLAHNGVSAREEQQAQTDAAGAEADRDAALQALQALNVDPQTIKTIHQGKPVSHVPAVIRAPIAGTVAEKLISPGQLLQAGTTPAFTVADLSRIWVEAQIFDSDLGAVGAGDQAQIDLGAGQHPLEGRVDKIAPLVNPDTRSVLARVVVDNPGAALRKGMYVHVLIRARRESGGTLVPVSAILHDDENLPFVYVAQSDGSFARRHVTLGVRANDSYDISDGVKPGDRVVMDGGLFIQFMQSQ